MGKYKKIKSIVHEENIKTIHTHFMVYNYTLFLLKNIFLFKIKFIGQFIANINYLKINGEKLKE